jgi:CO dehydrogenase maturation factor
MTIADMEAGLEHLSRSNGTLKHVDVLLIVLEPYHKALETARRTLYLAQELGIPRIYGIASKVEDEDDARRVEAFANEHGIEVIGTIPYDDEVRRADKTGRSVLDAAPGSVAVVAVEELLDRLEFMAEEVGASAG